MHAAHLQSIQPFTVKEKRFAQVNFLAISLQEYLTFLICILISVVFIFASQNPRIDALRARVVELSARQLAFFAARDAATDPAADLARLRRRVTELMLENSQLRQAGLQNERLRSMLGFKQHTPFQMVSARVIAINRDKFIRSVVLDAGATRGIRKNMPVVLPEGLCGKIIRADSTSAVAQLLVDHNFRVPAKVERTRVDGIVSYEEGDDCILKNVPKNADVRVGDVVVSSGYSKIFPAQLRIGVVVGVEENNQSLFKSIRVALAVDFSRLEEVFIITSYAPEGTH